MYDLDEVDPPDDATGDDVPEFMKPDEDWREDEPGGAPPGTGPSDNPAGGDDDSGDDDSGGDDNSGDDHDKE